MDNIEITLDLLIKYLGQPTKFSSNTCNWQCPYCRDSHKDNLVYTKDKGILWCFASDGEHSKLVLSDILKKEGCEHKSFWENLSYKRQEFKDKKLEEQANKYSAIYAEKKQKEFISYAAINTISLMGNLDAQTMLLSKRGITKETAINVLLGYDESRERWVIPTIKYSTNYETYLIGFEYRPLNFSKDKICREKNTPSALAQINAFNDQPYLIITEGYFDGYALYQYLTEQKQINDYHIVTCSNGVGGLLKQLSIIDFSKYEKSYLLIDNDVTSIPIANKICEKYPNIINLTPNMFKVCNCKDFNEHYLKCLYKNRIANIYDFDNLKQIKNVNELINYFKEQETFIYSEKINKEYCLEKAKSKENIIIECVKYFNGEYNGTYIAKILTGIPNYYDTLKDDPFVCNSPYYKIYSHNDYYEIKDIIYNLIANNTFKTQNNKKSGKISINED